MYELNIELKYAGLFEKVHLQQATSMVLFSSINTMFYFYKHHQIREENDLLIFA